MEFILKSLSPQMLLIFVPMLLIRLGNWFKNKDKNETGGDDAFGNVLIGLAPAISAISDNNENALKKALRVVYETLGNYLNTTPPIYEPARKSGRELSNELHERLSYETNS